MSHFTVIVIGDDVEGQLAPYQENNMGDCPQEYLEFVDDDEYDVDEKTGKRGYWENKNAKWDWWVVGGRWSGFFKIKDGENSNTALKKDIDIEGMKYAAKQDAEKDYDNIMAIVGDLSDFKAWEAIKAEIIDLDEARTEYQGQRAVAVFRSVYPFSMLDDYAIPRDDFVRGKVESTIVPFAVLKDGQWHERGLMGWWGCVSDEKNQSEWNGEFHKLFSDLPEDALLTVVDCHI